MLSATYKRYALAMLTGVYTLNLLDRGLIVLLLQPIKEDLRLSDTQLGLLTGIAFGLFYATAGVPLARWADRGNRVDLTSIAIALWGLSVMACVFVTNYVQLVLARVAAAVGESGCKPPTYSLIGDYFPQAAERTRAMSIYWLGSPLATLISFIAGGWLHELYGWRLTFFLIGIPGLLIAAVVKLTIVEPRLNAGSVNGGTCVLPPLRAVLAALWRKPSLRHSSAALILFYTMGAGLGPWYAAFMMRTHAMHTGELGLWLGAIFGGGGALGILLGGQLASRLFADDERGQMRLSAVTIAALVPCFVAFLVLPGRYQALLALVPLMVVFNFFFAPTYALMQRLVPDEMRATSIAVVMLLAHVIGMGIGPLLVGILSDLLAPLLGAGALRYAMLSMSFVALWASYHFWQAGHTVGADLAAVALSAAPRALG
jgi:predicted MFS family arabinose efflux permease